MSHSNKRQIEGGTQESTKQIDYLSSRYSASVSFTPSNRYCSSSISSLQ